MNWREWLWRYRYAIPFGIIAADLAYAFVMLLAFHINVVSP